MEILRYFGRNVDFQAVNAYFYGFGAAKLRRNVAKLVQSVAKVVQKCAKVVQNDAIFVHFETADYADFTDLRKINH